MKITQKRDDKSPIDFRWVKDIKDDNEKLKFLQMLQGSSSVLKVLKSIILDEKRALEASEVSIRDFDQPNWAEKQAFRNGSRRSLKLVEDLLHFI